MKKHLNCHKSAALFKCAVLISLVMILFACEGSNEDVSSETGSLKLNVEWQDQPASHITENSLDIDKILNISELFFPSAIAAATDDICNKNVGKIVAVVTDENNLTLKRGEWFCSLHTGTISDIKAGTNRKVIITGYDLNKTKALYQGKKEGITITAGKPTTITNPIVCTAVANNQLIAKIARPLDWTKYNTNTPIGFSSNGSSGERYDWDFGDNTPHSTEQNPSHTYIKGNIYTVTLTVTDNSGTFESSSFISLNISDSSDITICGKLNLTGMTPPAILENEIREYTLTGSGFCSYTTISIDVGAFVGSDPQKAANSQPSYVSLDGTVLKVFIYAAKTPDKSGAKIMVKNQGREETAELAVGFQR